MKSQMIKGLVVIALTGHMAFGGVSEAKQFVVNSTKAAVALAADKANQCYEAAKPCVQRGYAVVAAKTTAGVNHVCAAAKPVKEGFVNGAMVLFDRSGAAKLWVNHHDACIVGLTLTGMAAIYAAYKYHKHCANKKNN